MDHRNKVRYWIRTRQSNLELVTAQNDFRRTVRFGGQVTTRTQQGQGEAKNRGVEFADPLALAKQATQGRVAVQSVDGGSDTAGFSMWQGSIWSGVPGPFQRWMLTDNSHHLWRADLPADLPVGTHQLHVHVIDPHGRIFEDTITFEVVETLPQMTWQASFWQE